MPYLIFMLCLLMISCSSSVHYDPIANHSSSQQLARLQQELENPDSRTVLVAAHRSCWAQGAPENSLSSIQACIDAGIDIIEIDVRLTKDNMPVLLHDSTLDRTTSGTGKLNEQNWADVKLLTLYTRTGGKEEYLTQQHIPTLEQALNQAKGKILINLDVKNGHYAETFSVVKKLGMEDQIIMKTDVAANDPELLKAPYLGHTYFMPVIHQCSAARYRSVCSNTLSSRIPQYHSLSPVAYEITYTNDTFLLEGSKEMKKARGRVWVNSLFPTHAAGLTDRQALKDPDKVWGHIIRCGANIIQTDYPTQLLHYLRRKQRH